MGEERVGPERGWGAVARKGFLWGEGGGLCSRGWVGCGVVPYYGIWGLSGCAC